MREILLIIALTTAWTLTACGNQGDTKGAPSVPTTAPASAASSTTTPPPHVGTLQQVTVTAQGSGPTPGQAVQEAMKLAILEVNGTTIETSSIALKFGLNLSDGQTEAMLKGSAFAEALAQRSRGAITGFKLVSMAEPTEKNAPFRATITALVAQFQPPADSHKIKIVVAPLHVNATAYEFGAQSFQSSTVAAEIRQQIIDALVSTGRFSVLDRDFGPEVEQELDLIATGQTPNNEMAKLSQTLSADIVWIGSINTFDLRVDFRSS